MERPAETRDPAGLRVDAALAVLERFFKAGLLTEDERDKAADSLRERHGVSDSSLHRRD